MTSLQPQQPGTMYNKAKWESAVKFVGAPVVNGMATAASTPGPLRAKVIAGVLGAGGQIVSTAAKDFAGGKGPIPEFTSSVAGAGFSTLATIAQKRPGAPQAWLGQYAAFRINASVGFLAQQGPKVFPDNENAAISFNVGMAGLGGGLGKGVLKAGNSAGTGTGATMKEIGGESAHGAWSKGTAKLSSEASKIAASSNVQSALSATEGVTQQVGTEQTSNFKPQQQPRLQLQLEPQQQGPNL